MSKFKQKRASQVLDWGLTPPSNVTVPGHNVVVGNDVLYNYNNEKRLKKRKTVKKKYI